MVLHLQDVKNATALGESRRSKLPPKSKAQARFMGAVIAGKARKKGPTKKQAREFLRGHKVKGLPHKVRKKKRKKKKRR